METVEQADLILYNTCSIRDKAEQKVFHRLADFKKLQAQAKKFGVLGCVAQQEGEKIFERAPHVSLVCGSASYRKLPEMLAQVGSSAGSCPLGKLRRGRKPEASASSVRITGLDDRADRRVLRDRIHRAHESASRLHHHHRRLRQVLRLLRGAVHARQRAQPHVGIRAGRSAPDGRSGLHRDSTARAEREFLPRSCMGSKSFAELLAAVGEVPGIRRVRFTTSHPRDFGRDIVEAIDAVPTLCDHVHLPVQSGSTRVLDAMQRLYTREQYLERIAWMKSAKREISITTDVIVGFPGETEADFAETAEPARRSGLRRRVLVQVLAAAEHCRR